MTEAPVLDDVGGAVGDWPMAFRPLVADSEWPTVARNHPAYGINRRRRGHAYIQAIRDKTTCASCGAQPIEWHNPEHVAKPHRRLVFMSGASLATIDAEIAACTPLCRRCHEITDGRMAALLKFSQPQPPKACLTCGVLAKPRRQGECKRCAQRRYNAANPCPYCGGPKRRQSTLCRSCENWRRGAVHVAA